jgi:Xaa-Pro aminopeptidase
MAARLRRPEEKEEANVVTSTIDRAGSQAAPGSGSGHAPPFATDKLDELLDAAGIDALVVTSKHNVQYLLGDYRFFFFDYMDAIGISRYLPVLVYVKGRPDRAAYVGNHMESYEQELGRFWVPTVRPDASGTLDAIGLAVEHLRSLGKPPRRIGVETAFMPVEAWQALADAMPESEIVDALFPLERLRACKRPEELDRLRRASESVVASMLQVMAGHGPGTTKRELVDALRREEVTRGLTFEYCLITTGTSLNRAPSDARWEKGAILSLDSGGNHRGYIGDLCRMAILGEPDTELQDLLGEVDAIQQAARQPIRAGALGREIFATATPLLERSAHKPYTHFVAHGMGLISHEAPRLTSKGPVPYPAYDAERPLEAGMVISIETTMHHPRRGFVKLEDTVAVTKDGYEAFGDKGRGWNRGGTALA